MTTYYGTFTGTFTGSFTADGAPPDTTPPPDTEPPPIDPVPADAIWCGTGRPIFEPADAIGSVPAGGTLVVEDGRYTKCFFADKEDLTIRSASGNPFKCYFDGQGGYGGGHKLTWGKGFIHVSKSSTFIGLGFRNCGSPQSGTNYSNEAGLWIGDTQGTPCVVAAQRCSYDNCGNGNFCAGEGNIAVYVAECLFGYLSPNGQNASLSSGGGPAHDNYLAAGTVEVSHSYFYGCANGHNIKSRSPDSCVHDNPCMCQDGGRAFESSDGGNATFTHNVVFTRTDRSGKWHGNANMLAYCAESQGNGAETMTMGGNVLHVSRANSTIWAGAGAIASSGDTVRYYAGGSLQTQGNVTGLEQGSAPPGAPAAPAMPAPPAWAAV